MKRILPILVLIVSTTLQYGCGMCKSVQQDKVELVNDSSLTHWMMFNDSIKNPSKNMIDLKADKENLKRMQNQLDKEKEEPYIGRMLYYFFRDVLKR